MEEETGRWSGGISTEKGFTGVYRKGFTKGLLFVSSWFSDIIRGVVRGA
jgi:hypothetical protein